MSDFHVCEKCGADFQCFSSEPHVCDEGVPDFDDWVPPPPEAVQSFKCIPVEEHERLKQVEPQLAGRTRERDLAETCASALQATLDMAVQERELFREQLEAERATSHGLRLLNGTNDAVQVQIIKERDEARAESARLREALREITRSGPDDGWQAARIARTALAKETT